MKVFSVRENLHNELIQAKKDFIEITTSSSKTIIYQDLEVFIAPSYIPKKYMYLFKQIRHDIKSNQSQFIDFDPIKSVKDVTYFHRKRGRLNRDIMKTVEFDLNKAYYQEARNKNYISEKYFTRSIEAPKKLRLVLLGSIASMKVTTEYKNGEVFKIHPPEMDDFLRACWFNICFGVGQMLMKIIYSDRYLSDRFLFMWVDALFFEYETEQEKAQIQENLTRQADTYGHTFKRVDLDLIEERGIYFNVWETGAESGKLFAVY